MDVMDDDDDGPPPTALTVILTSALIGGLLGPAGALAAGTLATVILSRMQGPDKPA